METELEKLNSTAKSLVMSLLVAVVLPSIAYFGLTADMVPPEEITKLGNMVVLSDAENELKDFSLIPKHEMAVSETVTVTVVNSNDEVYAMRQVLG